MMMLNSYLVALRADSEEIPLQGLLKIISKHQRCAAFTLELERKKKI